MSDHSNLYTKRESKKMILPLLLKKELRFMVEDFWEEFLRNYPQYKDKTYTARGFGVDANELSNLVVKGVKTASTSPFRLYAIDNEALPQIGDLSIVLAGNGDPVCVIKHTRVYQVPFKDVTEEHAFKEGEGDRSLEYWRKAHYRFFIPLFESYNLEFTEDEIIVCEEFKCLFSK